MEKSLFEKKKIKKYVEGNIIKDPILRDVPPLTPTTIRRALNTDAPVFRALQSIPPQIPVVDRSFVFDGSTSLSHNIPNNSKTQFKINKFNFYTYIKPAWTGASTEQEMILWTLMPHTPDPENGYYTTQTISLMRIEEAGGEFVDYLSYKRILRLQNADNVFERRVKLLNQDADTLRLAVRLNRGIPEIILEDGVRNRNAIQNVSNGTNSAWYVSWSNGFYAMFYGAKYDLVNSFVGEMYDIGMAMRGYPLVLGNSNLYLKSFDVSYAFDFESLESTRSLYTNSVTLAVNGTESFNPAI